MPPCNTSADGTGDHSVIGDEPRQTRLERRLRGPNVTWKDDRLVRACLNGDERAWAALIQKYKNLIFSIPVKYGAGPEDAADIFQSVCMELFTELPRLRDPGAFRSWLITVTAHQAFHWKRKTRRRGEEALSSEEETLASAPSPDLIEKVEQEQVLREAITRLSARCQTLIRLLFYTQPQMSYKDVAKALGVATGSIGFIRGRCLTRLLKTLEQAGF
jgi:RNA polymerase sigma factor (sigma-70 family)